MENMKLTTKLFEKAACRIVDGFETEMIKSGERKIVTTPKQLKAALDSEVDEFYVVGELAENIIKAEKVLQLSKPMLDLLKKKLKKSLENSPSGSKISLAEVAPIATLTGLEAGVIIAIIFIGGLTIVYAIYSTYKIIKNPDSVEIEVDGPSTDGGGVKSGKIVIKCEKKIKRMKKSENEK